MDYRRGRYRCAGCGKEYVPADVLNCLVKSGETGKENTGYTLGARMVIAGDAAGEAYAPTSEGVKPEIQVSRQEVARIAAEVADCRIEEEAGTVAAKLGGRETPGPMPTGEGVALGSSWQEKELPEGPACCIGLDGGRFRTCERGKDGKFEFREGRVGTITVTSKGEQLPKEKAGGKLYLARVALLFSVEKMVELLFAAYMTLPARVRGLPLVFIGDGGPWWEWVSVHFPQAVQILDIFHAGEHCVAAAVWCFGEGSDTVGQWRADIRERLKRPGGLEEVIAALYRGRPNVVENPKTHHEVLNAIRYLREHRHRMRYWEYEKAGLPIGSGGIESAVDLVIEERLRERGRRWRLENADRMMCLRATVLSGELKPLFQRRRQAALEAGRAFFEPLQHAA